MKTKRRHELQTNQLADWLGNKIQAVKPYRQLIIGSVIAAVVLIGIIAYFTIRSKNRVAEESAAFVLLNLKAPSEQNPREFEKVIDAYPESRYAAWALKRAGDLELSEVANGLLYSDRATAKSRLTKAKQLYERVLDLAQNDPQLYRLAQYSLAQTHETLGEIDEALKLYKQLVDKAPDSAVGKGAERRIKRLDSQIVTKFYEEFTNYVPPEPEPRVLTMADLPKRPDLEFPGDYAPLPQRPDISFPSLDEATSPNGADASTNGGTSDGTSSTPPPENSDSPATGTPETTPKKDSSGTPEVPPDGKQKDSETTPSTESPSKDSSE